MKVKESFLSKSFDVFNIIMLILASVVCIYPIWYVLIASISDSSLLMQNSGLMLLPQGFSTAAYEAVLSNPLILSGYLNTLKILFISVSLSLALTSIGAYFLSRKDVMFKKPIMIAIIITMFITGGMIPFYQTLQDYHLLETHWGIILPFAISTYNLIIMRTSFEAIPESLLEAARIDGAGHIRILCTIMLPLSKAIIAVMVLYYGVSVWNGWFWGSTILSDRTMYPLQVVLREILIVNDVSSMTSGISSGDVEAVGVTIRYATIIVATAPIVCVYPMIQKYFATGTMVGAVKE